MVVIEFRMRLPLEVPEYQVAQLYMVAKASKENTGGGEGVEVLRNEPYDNTDGHWGVSEFSGITVPRNQGQYTLKKYHIASQIPGFIAALLPADAMVLIEEAWNAYPHCVTCLTNGYLLSTKFRVIVESMHLPDRGTTENALSLSPEELKVREVRYVDIAAPVPHDKYVEKEDPTKFKSEKTGRGLLTDGWHESHEPIMTAYKVVRCDFKYWGLQTRAEATITNSQQSLMALTHRQAFCLIDEWHGLTMADIRRIEDETQAELERLRVTEEARGNLRSKKASA